MQKLTYLASLALILSAPVAIAQQPTDSPREEVREIFDLNRAKNYARMAAERANGGLQNYSAEFAMHGQAEDAPHVMNPDGSVTFTFTGTLWGATEALDREVETSVRVGPGRDDVDVLFNRVAR